MEKDKIEKGEINYNEVLMNLSLEIAKMSIKIAVAPNSQKERFLGTLQEAEKFLTLDQENKSAKEQTEIIDIENIFNIVNKIREISDEEITVKCSAEEVAKHFAREIIWYEPEDNSSKSKSDIAELKKVRNVRVFSDWSQAFECLNQIQNFVQVIIPKAVSSENLVKKIQDNKNVSSIYVYGGDMNQNQDWINKCERKVFVVNSFANLVQEIEKALRRSDFPVFNPIFDDIDISENDFLHVYLKGFSCFKRREQAKRDFLVLAKQIYLKKDNNSSEDSAIFADFEKNYNSYDMKTILHYYTKQCFIYKMTNNCLRISDTNSIQYCRFVIADIHKAIKERYNSKSKHFSGILFRGTFISVHEWARLEQNIGKEIEMYGFLSTTKDRKMAEIYAQNVFITIIISLDPNNNPNEKSERDYGFAEVKDFSAFPDEDEVIFNIMSRFTILETIKNGIDLKRRKCNHLVLLYDAMTPRRYLKVHNPLISIKVPLELNCHLCKISKDKSEEDLFYSNLSINGPYTCHKCIKSFKNKSPLLCFSSQLQKVCSPFDESKMDLKIEGLQLKYSDDFDIPFYGYKCLKCNQRESKRFYTCLACKESTRAWCENCFNAGNNCITQGHSIILENRPYSIWTKRMTENEFIHIEYQKALPIDTSSQFYLGEIFEATHNDEKAAEYYQKCLDEGKKLSYESVIHLLFKLGDAHRNLENNRKAIEFYKKSLELCQLLQNNHIAAILYNNIGKAHCDLNEFKEALKYFLDSSFVYKLIYGENHPSVATSYNNIGGTYIRLKKHQEAIQFSSKSLEIMKRSGDQHPIMAASCMNLGSVYIKMGDYEKAFELSKQSLDISKALFGEKHNSVEAAYNNLGKVLIKLGKYKEAFDCNSKALKVNQALYGQNHMKLVISYINLASTCRLLAEYDQANQLCSKSLEIFHKVSRDEKHKALANIYNELGNIYLDSGKHSEALKSFVDSLKINEKIFKDKHFSKADLYNNIGTAYQALNDHKKAIQYFLDSVKFIEEIYGDGHFSLATYYNNLGKSYNDLRQHNKAIECYLRSLEISKAIHGDNGLSQACTENNLGKTYSDIGNHHQAAQLCLKSKEIMEKIYGEKHPKTATVYNNLAKICFDLQQFEKAKELYSKCLDAYKNNQPRLAFTYNFLGYTYSYLKEPQKAFDNYSEALKILLSLYGESHLDVAMTYDYFGNTYGNLKDFQKAKQYYSKSLDIRKKLYVEEKNPMLGTSYCNLGVTLFNLGEHKEAIEMNIKSIEILKESSEKKNQIIPALFNYIGKSFYNLEEKQKAIDFYLKASQAYKAINMDKNPAMIGVNIGLGIMHKERGEHEKAINFFLISLNICKEIPTYGNKHSMTALVYQHLGDVYAESGNYSKAVEFYLNSLDIYKSLNGEKGPILLTLYIKLNKAYIELKEYQKANEMYLKIVNKN